MSDVRQKVAIGLAEALAGDDEPTEAEGLALAALAEEIERAMFASFAGTSKDYKSKYRTLLFNLKDEKNPTLRRRVRSRELSIEQLITLDAKALASEELQTARQELQERYFKTREQVDGELLVGWQAGTRGSLTTHKNTDVNKLGSAARVADDLPPAPGSPVAMNDDDEDDEANERAGTPQAMEDGGTPLNDGDDDDDARARDDDDALDEDIWGVNGDDSADEQPPVKAARLASGVRAPLAAPSPPRPPLQPQPPRARPAPPPRTLPLPPPVSSPPPSAPPPPIVPPPPLVKAALSGTDWLLPADTEVVLASDTLLRARIQQAYAVRDRVCNVERGR